jgi:hypothetical protein
VNVETGPVSPTRPLGCRLGAASAKGSGRSFRSSPSRGPTQPRALGLPSRLRPALALCDARHRAGSQDRDRHRGNRGLGASTTLCLAGVGVGVEVIITYRSRADEAGGIVSGSSVMAPFSGTTSCGSAWPQSQLSSAPVTPPTLGGDITSVLTAPTGWTTGQRIEASGGARL